MRKCGWAALALFGSGAVSAQDAGLSVSAGLRTWYAEWTTFSYFPGLKDVAPQALIQVSASNKLILMPNVGVRYGNFVGSLSGLASTTFNMADGVDRKRQEWDANIGYVVLPGVTTTLGYKKVVQRQVQKNENDIAYRYEPGGPVLGVSASAPLNGPLSVYGALALGRLKTPKSEDAAVVKFDADYRLTEVGLSYSLSTDGLLRRWTIGGGYRIQVMSSKSAFGTQDGRDTTQGFTVAATATF
jgi:hypothetical protein